jgi:DNA-binding NarL/FixJ family response regulator
MTGNNFPATPLGGVQTSACIGVRPRVLLADDHPKVLARLSEILRTDYDIVGAVTDGLAAVDAAAILHPDVAILDISMPILDGLEAAARIDAGSTPPAVIMLSVHEDRAFFEAARTAGARGYVLKRTMSSELGAAIRLVLHGQLAYPALPPGDSGAA